MDPDSERALEEAQREEREFVLTLGGYALELPGGILVVHEKVPVPRFNFVQNVWVGPERQTSFFERALDHYFQRALRPTFRISYPAAPHLDRALRRFSFRPRSERRTLLTAEPDPVPAARIDGSFTTRESRPDELDEVCAFWLGVREQEEFRRGVEVAWHHPNPGERLIPWLARSGDRTVAAALLYSFRGATGIHAVATDPRERGRGAATALVAGILADAAEREATTLWIDSGSARLNRRLMDLGFVPVAQWEEYELPPDAQLALPDPGPPQPPRWRPPRGARRPPRA